MVTDYSHLSVSQGGHSLPHMSIYRTLRVLSSEKRASFPISLQGLVPSQKTKPSTLATPAYAFWTLNLPFLPQKNCSLIRVSVGTSMKPQLHPFRRGILSPKAGRLQGFWGHAYLSQDHPSFLNTQLPFNLFPMAPERPCCQETEPRNRSVPTLLSYQLAGAHSVFTDIRH